ncbi:MAG TPA: glycosyltransferase [Kofleriaceae bacterium]|jgi:dolichol-phosphate mannosyltransferase
MTRKTLIFIPTYNERDNVGPMCEQIFALGLDADVVFMDDGSPDGTGELLDALANRFPRLSVIHRAGKTGIGSAHHEGIAYAYDRGYDQLVTLDCDFTHSPALIPVFIEHAHSSDVVIGSRYIETNSLPGWTLFRRSLTRLGHFLTETMLGISQDATGAFRVYNLRRIPRELFALVESRGYAFFFESLFVIHKNGFKIAEVPIALPARTYGHSKMSLIEIQRSVRSLGAIFLANQTTPARFRLARKAAEIDPELVDPQNWNEYWGAKQRRATAVYDVIATLYRNAVIKRRLQATVQREFAPEAVLLHAGCGSGQVDVDLHEHARIVAVDISTSALELYRRENPRGEVKHASIFALPFDDGTFDGVYNLGVVEHFTRDELQRVFRELFRVLKPDGKLVLFWPHAYASSVLVLHAAHFVLNDVLRKQVRLHPPEVSLVHSSKEAAAILGEAGFSLASYTFGPRDLFVQAIVVAKKPDALRAVA